LISGVMTGVTAGAIIGFIGAAAFIAGLRFAAAFRFFFLAAFLAGFFFAAFRFAVFFFATRFLEDRFLDDRFLEDFFFAFFAVFFFAAFFFAAMVNSFSMVDRLLSCGGPTGPWFALPTFRFASNDVGEPIL